MNEIELSCSIMLHSFSLYRIIRFSEQRVRYAMMLVRFVVLCTTFFYYDTRVLYNIA